MESKDLRIGNLVTDQWYDSFKTIITIDSINGKGVNLTIEDDGNWPELAQHFITPEHTFDDLRGIPLTEDWLLKFGFEKVMEGEVECFYSPELRFKISYIFPFGFYENTYDINLECVHQLQNLYHSLTGQELTI